jgi:hypothetical protein
MHAKPASNSERPSPRPLPSKVGPWLERWVRLLDEQFRIPGTQFRFGIDPLLGFFAPIVGDALGALLASSLMFTAWRRGAGTSVLLQMLGNIALDTAVGSVPFVGDFIDIGFRANRRNLELLRNLKLSDDTYQSQPDWSSNRSSAANLSRRAPDKKGLVTDNLPDLFGARFGCHSVGFVCLAARLLSASVKACTVA